MNQNTLKAYFGFLTEPFSKEIATKSLFLSAQLKGLFERLQHFIGRRGIALIKRVKTSLHQDTLMSKWVQSSR